MAVRAEEIYSCFPTDYDVTSDAERSPPGGGEGQAPPPETDREYEIQIWRCDVRIGREVQVSVKGEGQEAT